MELIIHMFFKNPAIWTYVYPMNVICMNICILAIVLQMNFIRKQKKPVIFPALFIVAAAVCEYIYHIQKILDPVVASKFGMMVYMALFGSLIGTLIHLISKISKKNKKKSS